MCHQNLLLSKSNLLLKLCRKVIRSSNNINKNCHGDRDNNDNNNNINNSNN